MSYRLTLQSGLDFFTVSSAFQKTIRRGMEHEALWFGTELYLSGYEEYAWFRLRVIVSEDVGIANPALPAQVQALYQTYLDFKKKKNRHSPEKLPFFHALLLLVRSPKSRLIDNLLSEYMFIRDTVEAPDLNSKDLDFIKDLHTAAGKKLGRGLDHFYEEGGKIENCPDWLEEEEYNVRNRVWKKYQEEELKTTNSSLFQKDLFNEASEI
jgi:replication-associated recombination protein RarA